MGEVNILDIIQVMLNNRGIEHTTPNEDSVQIEIGADPILIDIWITPTEEGKVEVEWAITVQKLGTNNRSNQYAASNNSVVLKISDPSFEDHLMGYFIKIVAEAEDYAKDSIDAVGLMKDELGINNEAGSPDSL